MSADVNEIIQVGLSEEADRQVAEIIAVSKYFKDDQDVYKFAVGVALARNMHNEKWKDGSLERKKNKFSVSGLDPDGSLKSIISLLRPDAGNAPYRYSQWLAMAGINFLHTELVANAKSIIDVLELDDFQEGEKTRP